MTVAALMPGRMAAEEGGAAASPGDARHRPAAVRALRCIAAARAELQVAICWASRAQNVSFTRDTISCTCAPLRAPAQQ